MIFPELRLEFFKLITKKRNYWGFLVFMLLISLVYWAYRRDMHMHGLTSLGHKFNIDTLKFVNGPFLAEIAMVPWLLLLVPIFVSLVAGDQVASEVQDGTLRVILSRPVSRFRVLIAKFLVTFFYIAILLLATGGLGLIIGSLALGFGDLLVWEEVLGLAGRGVVIIPENQVLIRCFLAYLIASWGALTLGSLGILLSVLMKNANAAVVGTTSIYFMSHILSQVPFFYSMRSFLFTEHMLIWRKVFREIIPWVDIGKSCMYLGGWTLCFLIAAIAIFSLKDIKS